MMKFFHRIVVTSLQGDFSKIVFGILMILCSASSVAQTINRAEYFFDTDPGFGNGISLPIPSPSDQVTFTATISTAGLSPGYHVMFLRTQSSDYKWSLYEPQEFTIEAPITKAEYFFDVDPGFGAGMPLTIGSGQLTVNTSISTAGLADGDHILFIRTQSGDSKWSLSEPVAFYIRARIIEAEYFIDTDPGLGSGSPLTVSTPSDLVNINATIPVGALSLGDHYLFVRTKDILGKWSFIEPQLFHVDNVVPVGLQDFKAIVTNESKVKLSWTTLSENQNDFFSVQHSSDGFEFIEIDKVAGAGNSAQPKPYSTVHRDPVAGNNYYRLKQVDFDGKFTYSDIILANVSMGEDPVVYPNPADDKWIIDFTGTEKTESRLIELFDLNGKKFLDLTTGGERIIILNRQGMASGLYLLQITSENNRRVMKISFR